MSSIHPAIQETPVLTKEAADFVLRRVAKASTSVRKALERGDVPSAYGHAFASRWPQLSKAVRTGLQHVVSADNGAYYAELWSSGVGKDANWYAVTGAGVYEVQGITKGMPLSEALDRFLASTVEKAECAPCGQRRS